MSNNRPTVTVQGVGPKMDGTFDFYQVERRIVDVGAPGVYALVPVAEAACPDHPCGDCEWRPGVECGCEKVCHCGAEAESGLRDLLEPGNALLAEYRVLLREEVNALRRTPSDWDDATTPWGEGYNAAIATVLCVLDGEHERQ